MTCNTIKTAYAIHRIGSRNMCRYIADRSGLNVTFSEAGRIAAKATDADDFVRIWSDEFEWQDCHNLDGEVL